MVTHGPLADELVAAVRTIAGPQAHLQPVALAWSDGIDEARARIAAAIAPFAGSDARVLLVTDLFGDTPTNAALEFVEPGRVEVVTGVNLPMLVRMACGGEGRGDLEQTVRWLVTKGRRAIRRVGVGERTKAPGGAGG